MTETAGIPVEVAVDIRAEVGEGPHWDAGSMSLWFVDLTAGKVCRWDSLAATVSTFDVGQEVGAVVPRSGGGLVLAVRDGVGAASEAGDEFELRSPVDIDNAATRMNDAKCDPAGRLFAGTTAFDFSAGAGALYRIDSDWSWTTVVDGVTTSNGTAWSPDGSRMYFIDSADQGVDVFDYDVATGTASGLRRLVSIDRTDGIPDGMTVDADGNLWVACFAGGAVRCYSPDGRQLEIVRLPVGQVTSCAFGGADHRDLYITTAAYRMTPAQVAEEPLAGAVFVCRPGVTGLPAPEFAG